MMRPRFETWIPKKLGARLAVVGKVLCGDIKGPGGKGFVDRDVEASYPCTRPYDMCKTRFPPPSTTAIFIGWQISAALAAAMT
jgi:hypothetical protein